MSLGPLADPFVAVRLRESEWSDVLAVVMYTADDRMEGIAERIRKQALSVTEDAS